MSKHTVTRNAPAGANYGASIGLWVYESDANEVTLLTDPTAKRPYGVIVDAENKTAGLVTVQTFGACYEAQVETAAITKGTHMWVTGGANSKTKAASAGDYVGGTVIARADAAGGERDYGIFINPQINVMA